MKYILIIFVFMFYSCYQDLKENYKDRIRTILQNQADQEQKNFSIDTLLILSYNTVTNSKFYKSRLALLQERLSLETEVMNLYKENIAVTNLQLNEFNLNYPNSKDTARINYILKEQDEYYMQINESQNEISDIKNLINSVNKNKAKSPEASNEYVEITYYLKGKIENKSLDDTVSVFINTRNNELFRNTNELYVDYEKN